MPKLDLSGASINFEIWGEENQQNIVLVNGHTRPLNDFRTLGKNLVQEGWRVVAFDNRGSGLTSFAGPFTMQDMVHDLKSVIEQLASPDSALLGISMGGMISMQYAAHFGRALRSLVLVSTTAHYRHFLPSLKQWPDDEDGILKELSRYVNADFFAKNQVMMRSMAKAMAKSFSQSQGKSEGAKWQRQSTRNFDFISDLPLIAAKTSIIHGEVDAIIDVAAAHELHQHIPQSSLHVLSGLGHLLLVEGFQQLKEIILR